MEEQPAVRKLGGVEPRTFRGLRHAEYAKDFGHERCVGDGTRAGGGRAAIVPPATRDALAYSQPLGTVEWHEL